MMNVEPTNQPTVPDSTVWDSGEANVATAAATTPPTSKDLILDAAQRLLARHGYAGLSMRELAAESGLAKATIYHHFADKDAIFRSVLERDMALVHHQLVAAANEAIDAPGKLSAVIRTYVLLMRERRTIIMSVLQELGRDANKFCSFVHERRGHYIAPIATILKDGIADGVFRSLHVEQTAFALLGIINSVMLFTCDEIDPNVELAKGTVTAADEQFIEDTIDLFLHGIIAQDQAD